LTAKVDNYIQSLHNAKDGPDKWEEFILKWVKSSGERLDSLAERFLFDKVVVLYGTHRNGDATRGNRRVMTQVLAETPDLRDRIQLLKSILDKEPAEAKKFLTETFGERFKLAPVTPERRRMGSTEPIASNVTSGQGYAPSGLSVVVLLSVLGFLIYWFVIRRFRGKRPTRDSQEFIDMEAGLQENLLLRVD